MWQGIHGQDAIVERFRRILSRGRLASTYLFVGPPGVGKRSFAEQLAQTLLCQTVDAAAMAPCGQCDSCRQVAAHTHPDLILIAKPADKSEIPLALLIGDDDHRMQEGLCHDIGLKPFLGGRKVAIIDDADDLNEEGANALLKTLEEPPPATVLILIGTAAERQLPTIRSRSQIVRFAPLEAEMIAQILPAQGLVTDPAKAARLAEFAEGSLDKALALADDDLWEFRARLLTSLAEPRMPSIKLAEEFTSFVEAAGKEARLRRARSRLGIGFAVEFYRQLLRAQCGLPATGDAPLMQSIARATGNRPPDVERTAAQIERSLDALAHIDRNAHQSTLIEAWLNDVSAA